MAKIPSPNPSADPRRPAERVSRFVRDFTAGINRRELERLFDRDTSHALSVFSAGRRSDRDGEDPLQMLAQYVSFFAGIALELSPGRRLLFTFALLCPLLGFLDIDVDLGTRGLFIDASPLWFLISIAALVLLVGLELVDRMRVRDELEVARQLQRDLLPQETPFWPGWRMAHSYRTAAEIGGDYYDFQPLDDGRWVVAVGDASGHGISAGLLMAIANASLKTAIELDPSPSAVLRLLNRVLARSGGRRAFMTLFYGVLDVKTGEMEFAIAGHPFPLVRRASGEIEELGSGAFPLGLRRRGDYECHKLTIHPGDYLVIYSDGLPEAIGGEAEQSFGFDRLRRHLEKPGSSRSLHDNILKSVGVHLKDTDLQDDLTLVVLDRAPGKPKAPLGVPRRSAQGTFPVTRADEPPPKPPAMEPPPTEPPAMEQPPPMEPPPSEPPPMEPPPTEPPPMEPPPPEPPAIEPPPPPPDLPAETPPPPPPRRQGKVVAIPSLSGDGEDTP